MKEINIKTSIPYFSLLSLALFFCVWQLAGHYEIVDPIFISTPLNIAKSGFTLIKDIDFLRHIFNSFIVYFSGFFMAIVFGILAGLIIGTNKTLYQLSSPYILALHATPVIALVPLIIIWFGMNTTVLVVFLMAVIPILISTIDSARVANDSLIKMADSFGANRLFIIRTIIFPDSLPFILSGIRIAGGRSVIGLIIGGFLGGGLGIGALMQIYTDSFETDKLMFVIIIMILFNLVIYKTTSYAEKRLVTWKTS